jgi:hypothetical protein
MNRLAFTTLTSLAVLASGCVTRVVYTPAPQAPPPPPPGAVQAAPPAAPPAGAYVPDYYTWDGYEYVGVSGDQYVYWTGGTWLVCDAVILGRFHGWERYHTGWRRSAFRYHYRGHEYRR